MAKKSDDDLLTEGREMFELAEEAAAENHKVGLEDIRFARLGEQWDAAELTKRAQKSRPALTINKLQPIIRQVVNDGRQNKPAIKVRPVDDTGDPATAEVINGLIRNIESTSRADSAYDTALECAVSNGFGYIVVSLERPRWDAFEVDIKINRILNPLSILGDPYSTEADTNDWNDAFQLDTMAKEVFKRRFPDAKETDFSNDVWKSLGDNQKSWISDKTVTVAYWHQRREEKTTYYKFNDGRVLTDKQIVDEDVQVMMAAGDLQVVASREGEIACVKRHTMSGAEIIKTEEWPGHYIPISVCYGDEFSVEGQRYFRSLINPAKDAQRQLNYWRTNATELVALAPRAPFIGPEGAFIDPDKWATANVEDHPYLEYDPTAGPAPQRQPADSGIAAGSLQQAMNASDDIKAITGIYDASMGAQGNETSGRAIIARQRQGDKSSFHYIDNLSRCISQLGRIIVDLIPAVYNEERVIRVLGEDGEPSTEMINQEFPVLDEQGTPVTEQVEAEDGSIIERAVSGMHDLRVGRYDLVVQSGPSFGTRRQEAAEQMVSLIQSFPAAAPVLADLMAKSFDWPGAQEIADRLKTLNLMNEAEISLET